jgi:type II secretory pathway component PulC
MIDNHKILKKVAHLETLAYAMLEECQQTRVLMEKEGVSTSSTTTSAIAEEARRNLRARLLKPKN